MNKQRVAQMKEVMGLVILGLGAEVLGGTAVAGTGEEASRDKARGLLEQDTLTGDWGGLRSRAEASGWFFHANYSSDTLWNASGGQDGGHVGYAGLLDVGFDVDTELAGGWSGGLFHVNALWTHGPDLSLSGVGDFNTVSSLSSYDTVRLFEAWYEQELFEGKLSLRGGQMAAEEEFAYSDQGGTFLNATFGYPTLASAFDGHPQYSVAGLGARVRVEPQWDRMPGWYLQAAVFEGDPNGATDAEGGPLNTTGVRYDLQFGLVGMFELGYRLDEDHGWEGLPGAYKVGGYYHTDGEQRPGIADPNGRILSDNHLVYVMAEQMVWREADRESGDQGLGIFGALLSAPSDRNFVHVQANAGLTYTGLLPGRPADVSGVAFAYTDTTEGQAAAAGLRQTPEYVVEVTYRVQVAPWWSVQPDLQYIRDPGLVPGRADAWVLGLRTSVDF